MDKLKEQLALIQPHLFWVLSAVALLLVLGGWYMSVGELDNQRQSYSSAIAQGINGVKNIRNQHPLHPNDFTLQQMDLRNRQFSESIAKGWQAQYDRQAQVLIWPAVFRKDFHDAVNKRRTIELLDLKTRFEDDLDQEYRRQYRDFIEDVLPDLAKLIGAEWRASRAAGAGPVGAGPGFAGDGFGPGGPGIAGGAGGPGGPAAPVDKSIVLWAVENQQEILSNHFGIAGRSKDPTTLEVLYAQEDLWILTNIMQIIAKANEGAQFRHDAAIKLIDFVRIGRSAFGDAGGVIPTGGPLATAPVDPNAAQASAPEAQPASAAEPPPAPLPGDPANWRYVDAAFNPLSGEQLRAAHRNPTPTNALLLVAKRMPVRMRFQVDQRRINKILAECGNAQLPLEVRQLRINREPAPVGNPETAAAAMAALAGGQNPAGGPGPGAGSGPGFVPQGEGGRGPGGSPQPGGFGPTGGRPGPARPGDQFGGATPGRGMGSGSATGDATVDTNLIDIEIYGIVYIYNPVNLKVLGLEPPAGTAAAVPGGAQPR